MLTLSLMKLLRIGAVSLSVCLLAPLANGAEIVMASGTLQKCLGITPGSDRMARGPATQKRPSGPVPAAQPSTTTTSSSCGYNRLSPAQSSYPNLSFSAPLVSIPAVFLVESETGRKPPGAPYMSYGRRTFRPSLEGLECA